MAHQKVEKTLEINFQIIKSFKGFKILVIKKKKESFHKFLVKIISINYQIFKDKVSIKDK